jgi:hypothetical protein
MKDLVEKMATALVDFPQGVEVTEKESEEAPVIQLQVAKDDLAKIIGRKGRMIQAMRTILKAASGNQDRSVRLELVE